MTETCQVPPLPPEVMEVIIFHCNLTSVLHLRLVSRCVKTLVDSSTRFHDALEDIKINVHSSTLAEFVKTAPSVPFCNFSISNGWQSPTEFYRDTYLKKFKDSFCPAIRKLQVSRLFCCTLDSEWEFFKSLSALRELHIVDLKLVTPKNSECQSNCEASGQRLPWGGVNWKLKRLLVDYEEDSGDYLIELIKSCPSVEVIKIPRSRGMPIGSSAFDCAESAMKQGERYPYILRLGVQGHLRHLRTLDMNNRGMRMDVCSLEDLRFFGNLLENKKVRLEKVCPGFVLSVRDAVGLETFGNFVQRIGSFDGISGLLKKARNLEQLDVLDCVSERSEWKLDLSPIGLPALRKIRAWVSGTSTNVVKKQDFIERLFRQKKPRPSVRDLEIHYQMYERYTLPLRIKPEYLDTSFPNLTRLIIEIDDNRFSTGELERLVEVISRKELLEELCISRDGGIPEAAFFGVNQETPVFLRLKNLRKFRLRMSSTRWDSRSKRFQECEKTGFGMLELLSKMSLTHLNIAGWNWTQGTSGGIVRLLEGPFGQSVLRVYLQFKKDTVSQQKEHTELLESLEKVAHGNRVAKGLTCTTFEEFKTSMATSQGKEFLFINPSWML